MFQRSEIPADWSCGRVYELAVHPEVEREARGAGGSTLPLLLAICIEGFWSAQPLEPIIKYSVAVFFWVVLIVYLVFAGRGGNPNPQDEGDRSGESF